MQFKLDNVCVYNFENAIRGMRNPLNSWKNSDSEFGITSMKEFEGKVKDFVQKIVDAEPDKERKEIKEDL